MVQLCKAELLQKRRLKILHKCNSKMRPLEQLGTLWLNVSKLTECSSTVNYVTNRLCLLMLMLMLNSMS